MPATEKWVEIRAQQELKAMLRDYFLDLDAASHDPARGVAWCSSVGPCEILVALGYAVYFPENHGALLGARKVSHKYIPYSVNAGYCAESCSYMNSDIGASLAGYSPLKDAYDISGPPVPDVLVYSTNQCREVQDWWNFFGRRHRARVVGVRPPSHLGTVTSGMVSYVRGQLFELIDQIEGASGRKLSMSRLEDAVHESSRASRLWNKVLDTARSHPSPLTFFDGLIHMAPVVVMRGSRKAIEYYETLLAEMELRIREGVGAVPTERHRLYWEGMPVWPKIRELSEKFFDMGAVIAASTYCNSWAFAEYEGGDPLEWMARTSIEIFINRDEEYKQAFLAEMFDRFDIDGAVFHNARTCPNNTNSRFGMTRRIRDEMDMPVLVFDGDLSDVRFFSTAQTMTNLEAFIEQLEARKR